MAFERSPWQSNRFFPIRLPCFLYCSIAGSFIYIIIPSLSQTVMEQLSSFAQLGIIENMISVAKIMKITCIYDDLS